MRSRGGIAGVSETLESKVGAGVAWVHFRDCFW